jgi:RNA polymerase sigma factor (sigma-70 family)
MTDDNNFEEVYQQYKALVYNVCLNYLLNANDAQDVAQEVFIKVYKQLHQFDAKQASIKTWIYRIAINTALDFLKAKKTKKRFGFLVSIFDTDAPQLESKSLHVDHPGIQLEQKEALEKLMKIIYELPENQKTAIILSKIEGLPQQEVAVLMDKSVKAVESLIQRAKDTIGKKLERIEGT